MLARRFIVVCLLAALFGMGFAMLVAEASRSGRSRMIGMTPCGAGETIVCAPAFRGA